MSALTVLLTVYNGMPYLAESVQSILLQTLPDFTFLILNNGSTDGTRACLDSFSDPRLCIEHLPKNIGRTPVLNRGLATVRTEFTAIIDADDLAHPSRLEKQLALLQAHSDIDLAGSDVIYINQAGSPIGAEHYPTDHATLLARLPLHNQFSHAACMFRTAAAMNAGGYPAAFPYAQDFALWIAMLRNGSRIASIAEPLASIRVHPGQATRDSKLIATRSLDNHNLAEAMLAIPGLSLAARQAALLRSAGALRHLSRPAEARAQTWRAVLLAPWLLPFNPILWRRLIVLVRRFITPVKP